jgi:peptide methionine sulfoxide reductase msrA/msrB
MALKKATFAGGCFWCMEPPFAKIDGVTEVVPGYTGGNKENPTYNEVGGNKENPTYNEVSSGKSGHLEAVQVTYDPAKVSYDSLLDVFWRQIDPQDGGGQFADRGSQYRSAIFFHDTEQERLAVESKRMVQESGGIKGQVMTSILPAVKFWVAEEYHCRYHEKNPLRYNSYKVLSGRKPYLERTWGGH